ncbi:hypothetical protein [Litchfieldella anticariensis]|uniref:hypothetical protein n=1 Tax=Litchfieldella anticariensis TaxID=258591 RepID=UPI000398F5F4|nr:hypothetical protein [Halomonas anticariensis]
MPERLNVDLIGSGYMGKAHAIALEAAPTVFSLPANPVCELLAEVNEVFGQPQTIIPRRPLSGGSGSLGRWRTTTRPKYCCASTSA